MNLVLKVTSTNENYSAGCDYAFVELTAELAAIALRRIQTLKEQKKLDADIDETYYWSQFVNCFFSPWGNLAAADGDDDTASLAVADLLETLRVDVTEIAMVPKNFKVPSSHVAAMESEQMIVREDSIAFIAIPKHTNIYVQTTEVTIPLLAAAASEDPTSGAPTSAA